MARRSEKTASEFAREAVAAFGPRLKRVREAKGLTQEQLAERAEVTDRNISRYENGSHQPTLENLLKLVWGLGVEVSDLIIPKKE